MLLNTTRMRSGPPSTRATITMDGGVADTARANTKPRVNTGRYFFVGAARRGVYRGRRDSSGQNLEPIELCKPP
jgi:hypothetical protein